LLVFNRQYHVLDNDRDQDNDPMLQ